MKVMIADLGIGNLHSLAKALLVAGADVVVSRKPEDWLDAAALVLPGVGAFGAGMKPIQPVVEALQSKFRSGSPSLGVCLGMQLLFERSDEDPVDGLGFVAGSVRRFPDRAGKVPHMGWSTVHHEGDAIFEGVPQDAFFYFVHSYYPDPEDECQIATTTYGTTFPSVIKKGNVYATQFHPEKSGKDGLRILRNFVVFAEAHA